MKEVRNDNWQETALSLVKTSLERGDWARDLNAQIAANALIPHWEGHHPSWINTQFAIASFFLPEQSPRLRLLAYCMVANGLGGYWQWESHNPDKFSIVRALSYLDIITTEETKNVGQFVVHVTDSNCGYLIIKPALLHHLINQFNLPIGRFGIEGYIYPPEDSRLAEREQIKERCRPIIGYLDGLNNEYQRAFRMM